MRCISPLLIKGPSKRDVNGQSVRRSDERNFVPCGKCNFCLESKRGDWTFRLSQELRVAQSADFWTFTYDDDNVPVGESGLSLRKRDMQLFMKRLRKAQSGFGCDGRIRYYTVGEYGTQTDRPHYHSIMFNLDRRLLPQVQSIWTHGNVMRGSVTPASIHYVTKYVINRVGEFQGREPPFALMSKKPGLGSNYLQSHTKYHRHRYESFSRINGIAQRLPRYYRDKMFSDFDRSLLALRAADASVDLYWKEVERLERYHTDPEAYFDECIRHNHDMVTNKVNSNNIL